MLAFTLSSSRETEIQRPRKFELVVSEHITVDIVVNDKLDGLGESAVLNQLGTPSEILKIEPENDGCYYGIALSEYVLNQKKSSKENCEMALKLNLNNQNAKLLLQTTQLASGFDPQIFV